MNASPLDRLAVKIFADGADVGSIRALAAKPFIKGFTTNPTLMRKAGVLNYEAFAKEIIPLVAPRPVSFEVFADDFGEMERQARLIAAWGAHVYVKIPITNTKRESSAGLIRRLSADGVKLNVTAILTVGQVREAAEALDPSAPAIVSVFAGRVADTGVDPVPLMRESKAVLAGRPKAELLWASPRELLNIVQANAVSCDIITATPDVLKKLDTLGYDLADFSLDTVKMFHEDGKAAGYTL